MRILYVEDNPVDTELVREVLAHAAPDTVLEVAPTLETAFVRLEEPDLPDVLLTDLLLPDGSGLELLARVRARSLPMAVAILTGTGDQETVSAALKAGADAYFIKSGYDLDQLPHMLTQALGHFRATTASQVRPLRVLYAEDDPADVALLRQYMSQHAPHIQIDAAANARELLERLPAGEGGEAAYDLALLDDLLPGQDALALTKTLRQARGLTLPLVLVSGQGSERLAAEAMLLGVDDYLVKDASFLHKLPTVIESLCHRAGLLRERAALVESEKHIRLLLDSTAEAICGVDLEGRCTFVNPACLRILGYERADELVGQHIHELTHHSHPDGSPYPEEDCPIYRASLRDEAIHRDDEVFWRKDGRPVPVEYWSYPMHRDGQVVGAVATFFDITERKALEEKLRLAAMVFDNMRDGVLITDPDGRILAVNQAFSAITGYTADEARGKTPGILRSGRHDADFYRAMWAAIGEAGYWQGEIWNRRKNGEAYPQWLTISRVGGEPAGTGHYVAVFTDLSQLRRSEAQLDRLAHYDPLTGLPNQTLIQSRLEHAIERARRHGNRIGLLHIDLTQFKLVNDSLGHRQGDDLLRAAAGRLSGRVRKEDTLGRLGSDEFMLVLESMEGPHEAAEVARDLIAALALPFPSPGGREVFLWASIGISVHPDDGDDAVALMHAAEVAMYRAKERGRGRFCFYIADMNADALTMLGLEADMQRAVERRELVLHYQPKVDLHTGAIVGAEALLRWRRDGAPLSPGAFIPLAEKTGLIVPMGAWVVDEACRQMRAWQAEGFSDLRLAVNVSACQFRDEGFEAMVADALARHDIGPGRLELELTESMLMDNPAATARLLERLRGRGLKLSLDDFGTGYSSLSRLGRFPLDALKVDQSFVRDIVTDPDAAGIVSAIISLAQKMRLEVVAEGVETEAQLGYLARQGCDQIQGFLFSRPVPAEEFAALLRAGKSLPVAGEGQERQRTLLLVDDEPHVLSALRRMLRNEGYRILTAESAQQGLEILAMHDVQVILSDQRMPGMRGTEFLGRVKELYPDTVRIVLSGFAELETIIEAVNRGAIYKFLTKPWEEDLLRTHIRDAFRFFEAVVKPRERAADAPAVTP